MEDNEDADSKKSEAPNLGKLEYSLDYDFQKQEVIVRHALLRWFEIVRLLAQSRSDPSPRTTGDGHERHIGSLRQSLRVTG